jgi:glycosyltransferase involved in cell wall biosynthesis
VNVYLVAISVPTYVRRDAKFVTTDWYRSLVLLRDSFGGEFGRIHVLAPILTDEDGPAEQALERVEENRDDIALVPSFRLRTRCREYWLRHRRQWLAQLRPLVRRARVVHAGLCDVYRPIDLSAILEAHRQRKPCVFVQDTDIVAQVRQLAVGQSLLQRARALVYAHVYERLARHGASLASLSLLKGSAVMARYAPYARQPREFHDSSYLSAEMPPEALVAARLEELLSAHRPLQLVYCGRLVARKGIAHSLRILETARKQGAAVSLDIIGDGPDWDVIVQEVQTLRLGQSVRLLGPDRYGPELLRRLAGYDALLFTPLAEDTPRMIFDGYAAGLPLVGYDIGYVRERAAADGAAVLLPAGNIAASAQVVAGLARDRARLAQLVVKARVAGRYHAADNWYHRRAEWTREAVAREMNGSPRLLLTGVQR